MHECIVNTAYVHPRASGVNIDIVSIQRVVYPLGLSEYAPPTPSPKSGVDIYVFRDKELM